MKSLVLISLLFLVSVSACHKSSESDIKKSNFTAPEEYIKNPSVSAALKESEMSIYDGVNPPPLAGTYSVTGTVVDASEIISDMIDSPINSEFRLFNQTSSGKIDFQEKVSGVTAWGSGGYITGENGQFTIWQESTQTGGEAGLPDDITINAVLLMSGTKLTNGNLSAKGMSVITKVTTSNPDYDVQLLEGVWWMWQADFVLTGPKKSASKEMENIQTSFTFPTMLKGLIKYK